MYSLRTCENFFQRSCTIYSLLKYRVWGIEKEKENTGNTLLYLLLVPSPVCWSLRQFIFSSPPFSLLIFVLALLRVRNREKCVYFILFAIRNVLLFLFYLEHADNDWRQGLSSEFQILLIYWRWRWNRAWQKFEDRRPNSQSVWLRGIVWFLPHGKMLWKKGFISLLRDARWKERTYWQVTAWVAQDNDRGTNCLHFCK